MPDILADYREWSDQQAARVSTHSDGCHMWHRDCMIHRLADALERARLADEEREAIQRAIDSHQHRAAEMHSRSVLSRSRATEAIEDDCDTLRWLLERLGLRTTKISGIDYRSNHDRRGE
jgi:predicted phage gp36 major capsid-like protein